MHKFTPQGYPQIPIRDFIKFKSSTQDTKSPHLPIPQAVCEHRLKNLIIVRISNNGTS